MKRSNVVYLARHGRTDWNARGLFQGTADIPLDDVGREQAEAAGELLASEPVVAAVASDLARASETARIILAGRENVALRFDPRLRERHFGSWEGLTWDQICTTHLQFEGSRSMDVRTFTPEDGEAFDKVMARSGAAFADAVRDLADGENLLLVTHAGVLHALLDQLFGPERDTMQIPTAALLKVDVSDGVAHAFSRLEPVA